LPASRVGAWVRVKGIRGVEGLRGGAKGVRGHRAMARTASGRASGQVAHQKRGRSLGEGHQGVVGRGRARGSWGSMGNGGKGEDREGGSMWEAAVTGDHWLKLKGHWERGGMPRVWGRAKGEAVRPAAREERRQGEGTPGGQGGQLGDAGFQLVIGSKCFAMAGVCRISTTTARFFLEKANQRGHWKKGNR